MSNTIDLNTSELTVKNFGPIYEATVELRPLTVFAGPSNTGKSYLAILIYALHQMFGRPAKFSGLQGVFRGHLPAKIDIPKGAAKALRGWLSDMPKNSDTINITDPIYQLLRPILRKCDELFHEEVSRCFGTNISSLIRHPRKSSADIAIRGYASRDSKFVIDKGSKVTAIPPETAAFKVDDSSYIPGFDNIRYYSRHVEELDSDNSNSFLEYTLFPLIIPPIFGPFSRSAFYLPADRAGVMHAHRVVVSALIERATYTGTRLGTQVPVLSGVLADFLESLIGLDEKSLSAMHTGSPKGLGSEMDSLAKFLETDILGGTVKKESSETGYPIFYYYPEGWKDPLHLAHTSSMVSELAPIALYLRYIVRPGDVLIIEEPESHLHPSMQVALVHQLAAMVKSGIRVLITTHSEWMLEALTNLVRLSDLPEEKRKGLTGADHALTPEQVGVWLFESKNRPKGSVVKEVPLDYESGLYNAKYDDVGVTLHNDWARINNRIEEIASK